VRGVKQIEAANWRAGQFNGGGEWASLTASSQTLFEPQLSVSWCALLLWQPAVSAASSHCEPRISVSWYGLPLHRRSSSESSDFLMPGQPDLTQDQ
jgi:hypothetical protein